MSKLILSAPNNLSIEFSLQEETSIVSTSAVGGGQAGATSSKTKQRLRCRLFDHIMDGYEVDPSVSEWFCQVLGDKNLKFVRYTSKFIQNEAKGTKLLKSFKEFPYFMISEETIQDFHQHLLTLPSSSSLSSSSAGISFDLLIQRFRPNIVVKGCKSYDEDQWDGIVTPNGAVLSVVRLCDHCSMPNVHPIRGTMDTSLIISRVLKSYRTGKHLQLKSEFEKKVFLGVRLENDSTGMMTGGLGVLGALTGSRSRNEGDGVMLGSLSVGDKLDILH